jgi:hypothetical protein
MVEWVAEGHYYRKFCLIRECLASDVGVTCRMVEWVAEGYYYRNFCLIRECLARYVS